MTIQNKKMVFGSTLAVLMLVVVMGAYSADASERGARDGERLSDGNGNRVERMQERQAHREEMRAIMDSADYDAFVALRSDRPNAPEVSESDFGAHVAAHELRINGDIEGADKLLEDAGIERNMGKRHGGDERGEGCEFLK